MNKIKIITLVFVFHIICLIMFSYRPKVVEVGSGLQTLAKFCPMMYSIYIPIDYHPVNVEASTASHPFYCFFRYYSGCNYTTSISWCLQTIIQAVMSKVVNWRSWCSRIIERILSQYQRFGNSNPSCYLQGRGFPGVFNIDLKKNRIMIFQYWLNIIYGHPSPLIFPMIFLHFPQLEIENSSRENSNYEQSYSENGQSFRPFRCNYFRLFLMFFFLILTFWFGFF